MTYYKLRETIHPNIYEYDTKKAKLYAVRIGYTHQGQSEEFEKRNIKTIASAKSILRKIEEKIENYDTGLIGNKTITVSEYYPLFVEDKLRSKSWNKTSKQAYDSMFTNHILPVYGNMNIIKINRLHYQKFINDKLEIDKLSRESARSINNAFMALLNNAVDTGVIERNRLRRISIGKGQNKMKKKHLTVEEFQQFMKTAEEVIQNQHQ